MAVDDHGIEAIRKAAEQATTGNASDYYIKVDGRQYRSSTGSLNALNSSITLECAGLATARVFVSGTYDGNASTMGSLDGTNWFVIAGQREDVNLTFDYAVSGIDGPITDASFIFPIAGLKYFRIKDTGAGATGGTFTVGGSVGSNILDQIVGTQYTDVYRSGRYNASRPSLTDDQRYEFQLSRLSDLVTSPRDTQFELSTGRHSGQSLVHKFGNNNDIDSGTVPEDIWAGGGVYPGFPISSSEKVEVFSASANDTAAGTGARTIRIFGLNGSWALAQEDIILNGVTGVQSVGTYRRIYRAYILTAGSGGTNAGIITCRHITTTANIFFQMPAGISDTEASAYTIPAGYTGYLFYFSATLGDSSANNATMGIWTREFGGAERIRRKFYISTSHQINTDIYGGMILPEKTDVIIRCLSVTNNNAMIACQYSLLLEAN